jgi:hypothetical protein
VQTGPATYCVKSTTSTPASGWEIICCLALYIPLRR